MSEIRSTEGLCEKCKYRAIGTCYGEQFFFCDYYGKTGELRSVKDGVQYLDQSTCDKFEEGTDEYDKKKFNPADIGKNDPNKGIVKWRFS